METHTHTRVRQESARATRTTGLDVPAATALLCDVIRPADARQTSRRLTQEEDKKPLQVQVVKLEQVTPLRGRRKGHVGRPGAAAAAAAVTLASAVNRAAIASCVPQAPPPPRTARAAIRMIGRQLGQAVPSGGSFAAPARASPIGLLPSCPGGPIARATSNSNAALWWWWWRGGGLWQRLLQHFQKSDSFPHAIAA